MNRDPGDQCPRSYRGCSGSLERTFQTSTVPEFAFAYLRCPTCGWSNYEQRANAEGV